MLSVLSLIIAASILLLDVSHIFYQIVVLTFPAIMAGALLLIYDLDSLSWGKEIITLEPNERIFDALGVKRFYLKKRKPYISKWVKEYRTEDDLEGELKQAYLDVLARRTSF